MKNYCYHIGWRGADDKPAGRTSTVRAATVGDALAKALDKVEKQVARPIEVTKVVIEEVS